MPAGTAAICSPAWIVTTGEPAAARGTATVADAATLRACVDFRRLVGFLRVRFGHDRTRRTFPRMRRRTVRQRALRRRATRLDFGLDVGLGLAAAATGPGALGDGAGAGWSRSAIARTTSSPVMVTNSVPPSGVIASPVGCV